MLDPVHVLIFLTVVAIFVSTVAALQSILRSYFLAIDSTPRGDAEAAVLSHRKIGSRTYFSSDGEPVDLLTFDYARPYDIENSGVSRVSIERTAKMGFSRSRRAIDDVLSVLDREPVVCDDMMNPVVCSLDEGETACDFCVEARSHKRVCVRMDNDVPVSDGYTDRSVLRAHEDSNRGYCLPAAAERDKRRNCNPNTGDWLLMLTTSRPDDSTDSKSSSSERNVVGGYNWICRCRYPNLMTNLSGVNSDCLRPVGCSPGRLDDRSSVGAVDPYAEGRCVCPSSHRSAYDETVGPICTTRTVLEYEGGFSSLYEAMGLATDYPVLADGFVSRQFLQILYSGDNGKGERRRNHFLPDPCSIDILTGRPFASDEPGCKLAKRHLLPNVGDYVVFCESSDARYAPVQTSSDYLLNNHGRFPNACMRISRGHLSHQTSKREDTNAKSSAEKTQSTVVVNGLYMLSHFNGLGQPDFGVLLPPCETKDDESVRLLRRLLDACYRNPNDKDLREYYLNVTERARLYGERRYDLMYDASKLLFEDGNMVVYFASPANEYDALGVQRRDYMSPLLRDLYRAFHSASDKAVLFRGQKLDEFYRELSDSGSYHEWGRFTAHDYNRHFAMYLMSPSQGKVPEDRAIYFRWSEQTLDGVVADGQVHRARIAYDGWSENSRESLYPAVRAFCFSRATCKVKHAVDDREMKRSVMPTLWPCYYLDEDRPFVPNPNYLGFDGTVVALTTASGVFHLIVDRVADNFMNFQEHRSRFLSMLPTAAVREVLRKMGKN